MKKRIVVTLLTAILLLSVSTSLIAGDYISADHLKELLTNKTAKGEHLKRDYEFDSFFSPDGDLIQIRANGKKKTGKWSVKENGKHCVEWDGSDIRKCFPVMSNGDGSFTKVKVKNNGKIKKLIRWTNFRAGNQL